jgi:hypothetical protein
MWCIENYRGLGVGSRIPVPGRPEIVQWVNNAIQQITAKSVVYTFLSIGYYHPEDDNLDLSSQFDDFDLSVDGETNDGIGEVDLHG